jgi:ribosome-binding protein aMBF1 (putative translation factor)
MSGKSTGLLNQAGILTREQLALELNVREDTILRWEEEHGFPGKTVGRTTFYDVETIRKWIAAKPVG